MIDMTPESSKVLLQRMERACEPYHIHPNREGFDKNVGAGGPSTHTPIVKVLLQRMERAGLNGPVAQIFEIKN